MRNAERLKIGLKLLLLYEVLCNTTKLSANGLENCAMSKIMSIEEEEPPFSQPGQFESALYCSSSGRGPDSREMSPPGRAKITN